MTESKQALLRIEAPFCVRPCGWRSECSCTVIAGWDSKRQHDYFEAVCREVEANAQEFADFEFTAVRLGGGIASMGGESVSTLMRCVRKNLALAENTPVTMRSSISNISGANMPWFKRAGITRYDFEMMSLVLQDFNHLNTNDSLYDFETICDYILRTSANDNLGLILAYGMNASRPERTVQNLKDTLRKALQVHAAHISFIKYEGEDRASNEVCSEQLQQARELLDEAGFTEYIPLHFAREALKEAQGAAPQEGVKQEAQVAQRGTSRGEADIKGQEAWKARRNMPTGAYDLYFASRNAGMPELAFGLGAQTCIDGVVSTNTSDLQTYLHYSSDFSRITASIEPCLEQRARAS